MLLEGCQKNIEENLNGNSAEEVTEGLHNSSMGIIFEEFNPYESFYIISHDSVNTEPIKTYASLPPDNGFGCNCGEAPFIVDQERDVITPLPYTLTLNYDDVYYIGVGNGLSFNWSKTTKIGTFKFSKIGIKKFTLTGYKVTTRTINDNTAQCYCPKVVYNFTFNVGDGRK